MLGEIVSVSILVVREWRKAKLETTTLLSALEKGTLGSATKADH